jgi:hypothetical protein
MFDEIIINTAVDLDVGLELIRIDYFFVLF